MQFRVVLSHPTKFTSLTSVVEGKDLLAAVDFYEKEGYRWVIVKA